VRYNWISFFLFWNLPNLNRKQITFPSGRNLANLMDRSVRHCEFPLNSEDIWLSEYCSRNTSILSCCHSERRREIFIYKSRMNKQRELFHNSIFRIQSVTVVLNKRKPDGDISVECLDVARKISVCETRFARLYPQSISPLCSPREDLRCVRFNNDYRK